MDKWTRGIEKPEDVWRRLHGTEPPPELLRPSGWFADDINWPAPATGANITHAIVFEDKPVKGLRTVYEAYFNEQGDIDEVIRRELPGDEEE